MNIDEAVSLVNRQIMDANNGSPANFDEWHQKTEVVIRRLFGEDSPTHRKFEAVSFTPGIYTAQTDFSRYRRAGVLRVVSILEASKLELELDFSAVDSSSGSTDGGPRRVFVVHGRDDARKYEVESLLLKLTDEAPLILHQEANEGRALMEKIEHSTTMVSYAVVILTPDDFGRSAECEPELDQPRARQNVIFELGFFVGKLGRDRVTVLYTEGVEIPSDLSGIAYVALDEAGKWKSELARELHTAGLRLNWVALGSS